MKTYKLLTALAVFGVSQISHATGFVATLGETHGQVLLDQGSSYATAESGRELKANDRVFVLNGASAEIQYANGCAIKVNQNTVYNVSSDTHCKNAAANAKFVAPQYAAAIGAIEPAKPAQKPEVVKPEPEKVPASSVLGGVEEWSKPKPAEGSSTASASLQTVQTPPSLLASLGPKLAIPATLTGAVLFSALVGGGGSEGSPASPQ